MSGLRLFREKQQPSVSRKGPAKAWIDLHCHFLPGIDDGCRDAEESAGLLQYARSTGITGMIATPHYYPEETIDQFLLRRNAAEKELRSFLSSVNDPVPEWCTGAEVAYYDGLIRAEGIDRLCLGKSRYLLLELPFDRWTSQVIRDVYTLSNLYNITPVLAHLERYLDIQDKSMLEDLYESDVIIQMNGGYVLRKTKDAVRRIRKGLVQVLGSDAHNMTYRKPNLREAVRILDAEGLSEELRQTNREIFRASMGDNI